LKLPFAPDEAAHYRKTVRRDESGRSKKKRKTGKIPLSQVRLPGGEAKSERKKSKLSFTDLINLREQKYLQGR
jgi:hypothetical protein